MDTNRLEAFSDGVFAIATTLLILEIKVPPGEALGLGLLHLWPSYLAYAIGFIVIGAIWINHHAMFDWIVRADQKLLLLNTRKPLESDSSSASRATVWQLFLRSSIRGYP